MNSTYQATRHLFDASEHDKTDLLMRLLARDPALYMSLTGEDTNVNRLGISSLQLEEVTHLLCNGKAVNAIRLVRECTGKGLKESKEMVEKYRDTNPDILRRYNAARGRW